MRAFTTYQQCFQTLQDLHGDCDIRYVGPELNETFGFVHFGEKPSGDIMDESNIG